VISVYGSLDGTAWSATPLMVLVLDKDVDSTSTPDDLDIDPGAGYARFGTFHK
jgi:hypothetical protein